jgi:type II secretory pathway component PulF
MGPRRAFYEGLAGLLHAGIPVAAATRELATRGSGRFARAAAAVRDEVARGTPLAAAMDLHPGDFSALERALVRAGEGSGRLDAVARDLALLEERRESAVRALVMGLAYPVLVLHGVPVPLLVHHVVEGRYGAFVLGWAAFVVPAWAAALAAWAWQRRAPDTPGPSRLLARLPLVGPVVTNLALARWARTLGALEDAGLGADVQLREAAAATGLAHLRAELGAGEAAVRRGASRADALAGTGLPPELLAAVSVGEKAGNLGSTMAKCAGDLDDRARARLATLTAVAPVVATVIAGAAVLFAALSVVGGYYSGMKGL